MKRGDPLSPREMQMVRLLVAGKSREQISVAVHVSPSAVGATLQRVRLKLGVNTTAELAAKVGKLGVENLKVLNPFEDGRVGRPVMMVYLDDDNS